MLLLFLLSYFFAPRLSLELHVGPSQPHSTLTSAFAELDGNSPPHTIYVHYQSTPYREKFVVPTSQFSIIGVPDPDTGELPILDGENAITVNDQIFTNEIRGLIKVGTSNSPSIGCGDIEDITVSYLHLRNAHSTIDFEGNYPAGTKAYSGNAGCLYVECGKRILFSNNEIELCGNGIFVGINNGQTQDVTIRANYVHDNGNVGSYYEHNSYCSAVGLTYEFNKYGPLCPGCEGNNLKDRSINMVVRYNYIIDGNRQLDLVDNEDAPALLGGDRTLYDRSFVYGNIIEERTDAYNRQMIHFGGDSGDESIFRRGPLYAHWNTFISRRNGYSTLLRLSTPETTADLRNNIVYNSEISEDQFEMTSSGRGELSMRGNCARQGLVGSHFPPDPPEGSVSFSDMIYFPLNGAGFRDFDAFDYHLNGSSPCQNQQVPLSSAADVSDHFPVFEYVEPTSSRARNNHYDMGAFALRPDSSQVIAALAVGLSVGIVSLIVLLVVALVIVLFAVLTSKKKSLEGKKKTMKTRK